MNTAITAGNNVKISVKDYGPIAEAKDVELCPLTVFVGPSNTGKSYLAVLIYALFKALESDNIFSRNFAVRRRMRDRKDKTFEDGFISKGLISWLEGIPKENTEAISLNYADIPKEIKQWFDKEIPAAIGENFNKEILRCMGITQKTTDLVGKNFSLSMKVGQKELKLKSPREGSTMKIQKITIEDYSLYELGLLRESLASEKKVPASVLKEIFLDATLNEFLHTGKASESFYLPAARIGIMQSHRAIAGALVKRAPYAGLADLSVPTLSGIIADFLQEIILMDPDIIRGGNVEKVAQDMEKNILHGSIKAEIPGTDQNLQFFYKQNGLELPIMGASSMVSELAPVVLYLRHKVGKGDFLIIEEPESHLHPAAQREITEAIVQLVRAGVRVMVTTHSEYFLEKISNCVRRSKLKNNKKPSIDENELGVYSFSPKSTRDKRTVVKRLHFTNENGFSPDDHDEVASDSYNETIKILNQIDAEKK